MFCVSFGICFKKFFFGHSLYGCWLSGNETDDVFGIEWRICGRKAAITGSA